jgi:hypothetical protein
MQKTGQLYAVLAFNLVDSKFGSDAEQREKTASLPGIEIQSFSQ